MELKNIFLNLPIGVIITDSNYKIRYSNRYVKEHIGLETAQLEKVLEHIISGYDLDSDEKNAFEKSITLNGKVYLLQIFKTVGGIDPKNDIVILLSDPPELLATKKKLEENDKLLEQLQLIINFSYDGLYVTDKNGVTLCVNKSYERITGINVEELIGKNIVELESQGMFYPIITPWVLKNKKPVTAHQTIKTGKQVIITGNPVFDEQGEIVYVVTNVRDLTEIKQLRDEINKLKMEKKIYDNDIIACSAVMQALMNIALRVGEVDVTVLLLGESGVGKEVIAKYIHEISSRRNGPFVAINCGAIVPTLLESEMFGYEGGAFTGALSKGKLGLFETANKGVMFLDEIGDMSLDLQVKLFRVLQEGEIQRVGGTKKIPIDVRVICATNKNLDNMVREAKFREDLYYRLNVVTIEIPPLRLRKDDIAPFVFSYCNQFNKKYGKEKVLSPEVIQALTEYNWPGNIRELKNLVEQLVVLTKEDEIQLNQLPQKIRQKVTEDNPFSVVEQTPLLPTGKVEAVPLGERASIYSLINYYFNECCGKYNLQKRMMPETLQALEEYEWQGDTEKLKEVIEKLVLTGDEDIEAYNLPDMVYNSFHKNRSPIEIKRIIPLKVAVAEVERQLINLALKKHKSTRKAADELGITQPSVVRKAQKYKMHQSDT